MSGQRFHKDLHILFRGREYVINQRLRNGELRVKDVVTDEYKSVPEMELVEALFDGHLEFLGEGAGGSLAQIRAARSYVEDLSALNDGDPKQKKRKDEARRRYKYVSAVLSKGVKKLTKNTLGPLIKEVAALIKDPNSPSWSTLYNWVRAYMKSGEDIRVLVPATNKRGNTKPKYSGRRLKNYTERDNEKAEEVKQAIKFIVGVKFLTPQRNSVMETYRFLEGHIKDLNKFRKEKDKLPTPQPDSLYYYISKLDEYEVDAARYGKRYADRKHRQVMQSSRPTRPLELVQMDHTKTDLMAVDLETRLPIGRATLTDAIDVFSAMPLGSYIGFEPASYLSVMQCLVNAIKPKTYVKKLYPDVENEWNCYGLPELLIVDNGNEFHSLDMEDACLQLGFPAEYAAPGCPEYKGAKERYYKTLNIQLLHNTPGTTFSNFLDKEDYDPLKNAIIDVEDLKKIHHIYMIDIYSRQIHRGIRDVPARRWEEGISVFPPALPGKGTDLRVLLGHLEFRVISKQGVELFGLFYNCDALSVLRRETKGERVKIKYDPTEISVIYVADSKNGLFIPVPAVDQEYTKGLSLFQHDVIRNYARKIAEGFVDSDALWRARKKIQEIVDQAWNRSRKNSTRTTLARFKGIGLQNYWGAFEGEIDRNSERPITDSVQEGEQLLITPENTLSMAGVSDFGILLDSNHEDNQPLGDVSDNRRGLNAPEGVLLPKTTRNGNHLQDEQGPPKKGKAPKATVAEAALSTSPIDSDAPNGMSDEGAAEDEWAADYGHMDAEILKWQKQKQKQ